jgi:predicted tellurium resistance membrane protein TerC
MMHDLFGMLTLAAGSIGAEAGEPAALFSFASLMALLTLTALEIVLGIDNIVFITILVGKLPEEKRAAARRLGLGLAMGMRILLLLAIAWVMGLTAPLFELPFFTETVTDPETGAAIERGLAVSGRDLILLLGGTFLIGKATWELHHQVTGHAHAGGSGKAKKVAGFTGVIVQIMLLDLVFSLDSVITAVGMADHLAIMIAAVVIAIGVMMVFAGPVGRFVERHPTMKVLALSFLVLIGVLLVADGLHQHLDRGYVYFAMAFALGVDLLQMRVDKADEPADEPVE